MFLMHIKLQALKLLMCIKHIFEKQCNTGLDHCHEMNEFFFGIRTPPTDQNDANKSLDSVFCRGLFNSSKQHTEPEEQNQ